MQQQQDIFGDQRAPVSVLVDKAKWYGEDYEYYPSTPAQLEVVRADIEKNLSTHAKVLDCGAGDGRALEALTQGQRYAIEKSRPLLQAMHRNVFIVGTDFHQNTLIDKQVDAVFVNPPYSEFISWMVKIIREANAKRLYFIVPQRWQDSAEVKAALEMRKAEAHVLDESDFIGAERQARAKVHILRVDLCGSVRSYRRSEQRVDPFTLWFDSNFKLEINKTESEKWDLDRDRKSHVSTKLENALVNGGDVVSALESLYQLDLAHLIKNYQSLADIDPVLLRELDVNVDGVREALKGKIENLKDLYWKELFSNLGKVTERLCTSSRQQMLDKLTAHTHIDFTTSNARAVLIWVIKNANSYFDDQLIDLVKQTTEKGTISLYKSNERTFGEEQWRYCRSPESLDRYALDYRIVLHRVGGIKTGYSWGNAEKNLERRASDYINDILTVANNLRFDTTLQDRADRYEWESNKSVVFRYYDHITGEHAELMQVRAFLNGNLHIKFNQAFIARLNIEFGRLLGWLRSSKDAMDELGVSAEAARDGFGSNLALDAADNSVLGIAFQEAIGESEN